MLLPCRRVGGRGGPVTTLTARDAGLSIFATKNFPQIFGSARCEGTARGIPVSLERRRSAGWGHAVRPLLRGVRGRRDVQALAGQDGHGVRRPPVLPHHDEPPPAAPRRQLRGDPRSRARTSSSATTSTRCCSASPSPTSPARRSPTSRSSRSGTSSRRSTATRSTARPRCSTSARQSKDDRGVVYVETKGYNQDGILVCIFRRKVMVPKRPTATRTAASSPAARSWSSPKPKD